METTVRIVKIDKDSRITAVPVISDACINCSENGCKKTGKPFEITNPQKIPVYEGCIANIAINKRIAARQTIRTVLFPVLAAAAGYSLPTVITGKNFSEQGKIAVMFGFMCIAIIIVLLFSKKTKKSDTNHPYITAISVNK